MLLLIVVIEFGALDGPGDISSFLFLLTERSHRTGPLSVSFYRVPCCVDVPFFPLHLHPPVVQRTLDLLVAFRRDYLRPSTKHHIPAPAQHVKYESELHHHRDESKIRRIITSHHLRSSSCCCYCSIFPMLYDCRVTLNYKRGKRS
jgi:hypothetical protein